MATYLELVNKVARRLGWDDLTSGSFESPEQPYKSYKDFLNEAKDEVLEELEYKVGPEEEFVFNTTAPEETGTLTGSAGSASLTGSGTAFVAAHVGRKISSDGFTGFMRILTAPTGTSLTIDANIRTAFSAQDFSIFEDEYDLDARVRRVISAWTDDGPLALKFVSEPFDQDVNYPGNVAQGAPTEMALFRSDTTALIWQAQLRPAPDLAYTIRLKAHVRLADLSSTTGADSWQIPPEVETFIVDQAMFKALGTKIHNDPDLAATTRSSLRGRMGEYNQRNKERTPMRRLVRQAPDETRRNRRAHFDLTRFH